MLKTLVKDDSHFEPENRSKFIAEMKSIFTALRSQNITQLTQSEEFITLCFFKQEIVHFGANGEVMFTSMYNTDEGFVKDITVSLDYL